MFGLLVEVGAEIQTMAGGKAVIVTPGDVTGFLNSCLLYTSGFCPLPLAKYHGCCLTD